MENQTDKLVIDINANMKKGIEDRISNLAKSFNELNNAVKDVKSLQKYINTLNSLSGKTLKITTGTSVAKSQNVKNVLETQKVESTQVQEDINKGKEEELETTIQITAEHRKQILNGRKKNKQDKKNAKDEKKNMSSLSKIMRSFGRIALYRIVRASLSEIVKMFKEGMQNFVQFDDETNKAMSNISSSASQLKNTLGVTFGYIIQVAEPVITQMIQLLTEFTNGINMAIRSMQGEKTFQKAILNWEDYAEKVKDANEQLLGFDKFESLQKDSGAVSPNEMFENADIDDEWNDTAETFKEVLDIVMEVVEVFKELYPLVKRLLEEIEPLLKPILDLLVDVIELIIDIIDLLEPILNVVIDIVGGIIEQIRGAVQMISGILDILTGEFDSAWEKIGSGFANMINGIVNFFVGVINFIIELINTIVKPLTALGKKIFGKDNSLKKIEWKMDWKPYADGGDVPKGTRFIAGERGAEIVSTSPRGTGVTNIEQFTQAMLNALTVYGVARGSDVNFSGDVVMNSTKVGEMVESSVYREGVRVGHFRRV